MVWRQVEIMMALEEKFDLQLDEEGEHRLPSHLLLLAQQFNCYCLMLEVCYPTRCHMYVLNGPQFAPIRERTLRRLPSHYTAQVLRRLPPFRTLLTSSPSRSNRHEPLCCVDT